MTPADAQKKEEINMTRENAIVFLKEQGWDDIGAEEILDIVENLDEMTEEALAKLSEDYMDR